jgi:hypothetical protein
VTKEQILNLIDNGDEFDKIFDALDKRFLHKNSIYMDLCGEFVSRRDSFSKKEFRDRLKRFVSITEFPKANQKNQIDVFDLLCLLEFEPQSMNFKNIYKGNPVSAVLLHGENDDAGNDLKWLYNQLLITQISIDSAPIVIDFNGNINNCFDDMLKHLYNHLIGKFDYHKRKLIRAMAKRLETEHLVVIVKAPQKATVFKEFFNLFHDFLMDLQEEGLEENALIFLIVEDNVDCYKHLKGDNRFLWFDKARKDAYIHTLAQCQQPLIIDLAQVEMMETEMIKNWIIKHLHITEIKNNLFQYHTQLDVLLENRFNRYHVIKTICSKLNENPALWLKY